MATDQIVCDACGLAPHGAAMTLDGAGLPSGWYKRTFGRRSFTLCDCCGSILQFKGGVSPYLQEALGLAPTAFCDFSEPGSGLHRLRLTQPATMPDEPAGGDSTGSAPTPPEQEPKQ